MPELKEIFFDNVVFRTMTGLPPVEKLTVYRGDFFSFTVIGENRIGDLFDFSIFERFKAQFRSEPEGRSVVYNFPPEAFLLGKFEEESQNEWDELHVFDARALRLPVNLTHCFFDVAGMLEGEEYTFAQKEIEIITDVTRKGDKQCLIM